MSAARRKIVIHDFSGHGFSAQLARALAGRGHAVLHASFGAFGSPKGRLQVGPEDPLGLRFLQLEIGEAFDKDDLRRRFRQQLRYAGRAAALVRAERPDALLSGNAPIEVQAALCRATQRGGGRFVYWLQDVHALAIGAALARRSRIAGRMAAAAYGAAERWTLRRSNGVVAICEAFHTLASGPRWGVDGAKIAMVPNWAPLDETPMLPRDNATARAVYRAGRQRIVYAGTLERKHDPEVLVRLAQGVDADVHLFSAGSGAEQVKARAAELGLGNLFVRPWVGAAELPAVLAGADVLCAFIEREAGAFSVPSKVLSYLAAGRPILASIPADNLAARTIVGAEAGLVSEPGDGAALLRDATRLLEDGELRTRLGRNGRAHAEARFAIEPIAERFERLLVGGAV